MIDIHHRSAAPSQYFIDSEASAASFRRRWSASVSGANRNNRNRITTPPLYPLSSRERKKIDNSWSFSVVLRTNGKETQLWKSMVIWSARKKNGKQKLCPLIGTHLRYRVPRTTIAALFFTENGPRVRESVSGRRSIARRGARPRCRHFAAWWRRSTPDPRIWSSHEPYLIKVLKNWPNRCFKSESVSEDSSNLREPGHFPGASDYWSRGAAIRDTRRRPSNFLPANLFFPFERTKPYALCLTGPVPQPVITTPE